MLTHGAIPAGGGYHGTCVLHKCDNRACVNPDHLFLGSQADNVADMDGKGRRVGGKFEPRVGEANFSAKLTEAQVREIRLAVGTHRSIAAQYGVSYRQVGKIRKGQKWAHVTD